MPVGDFPTVFSTIMKCWLNSMVTSENGIIHTYMRCMYVHLQSCIHIYIYIRCEWTRCSWIGGWRYCIFSAYCDIFLLIMGRSIIFQGFFVILTMCFIIFHLFFSQLYGTTESYNVTLVERHGFQKRTVYRVRNPGGILTLFI